LYRHIFSIFFYNSILVLFIARDNFVHVFLSAAIVFKMDSEEHGPNNNERRNLDEGAEKLIEDLAKDIDCQESLENLEEHGPINNERWNLDEGAKKLIEDLAKDIDCQEA